MEESWNEYRNQTMEVVAENLFDGIIDMDVCDTEVGDVWVCFSYDIGDTNSAYERFLGCLAKNVKVVGFTNDDTLICDFSGYFEQFNDELIKLQEKEHWNTLEFDGDETFYDYVLWLQNLIPGNVQNSVYAKLLTVLK